MLGLQIEGKGLLDTSSLGMHALLRRYSTSKLVGGTSYSRVGKEERTDQREAGEVGIV
jgi:hypothetical protein